MNCLKVLAKMEYANMQRLLILMALPCFLSRYISTLMVITLILHFSTLNLHFSTLILLSILLLMVLGNDISACPCSRFYFFIAIIIANFGKSGSWLDNCRRGEFLRLDILVELSSRSYIFWSQRVIVEYWLPVELFPQVWIIVLIASWFL